MAGRRVVRDALRAEARRVVDASYAVQAEPAAVEAVHDLRVAVRRLRSVLRALRPLARAHALDELDALLRELADIVRPVRELDVLLATLDEFADVMPPDRSAAIRAPWLDQLREHRQTLVDVLASGLAHRIDDAALRLRRRHLRRGAGSAGQRLQPLVRRAMRRLTLATDAPVIADLHQVRILAKRLRYTAEFADAATGTSRHASVARRAQAVQAALGRLQDLTVLDATITQQVGDDASLHPLRVRIASARAEALHAWRSLGA